jgi:hypothetical protein
MAVVGAAAAFGVEQLAGDVGVMDAAGVLVFQLHQAAARAAVANALKLPRGHLRERLGAPEGVGHTSANSPIHGGKAKLRGRADLPTGSTHLC